MVTSPKSSAQSKETKKVSTDEAVETKTDKKSVAELTDEVFKGVWGWTKQDVADQLEKAGHDAKAVREEINNRVRSGAPSPLL